MQTVYRNDTDHEVWVRVTADTSGLPVTDPADLPQPEYRVNVTLDPDCPPAIVTPEQSQALPVEPGRELFADGAVTVETIE